VLPDPTDPVALDAAIERLKQWQVPTARCQAKKTGRSGMRSRSTRRRPVSLSTGRPSEHVCATGHEVYSVTDLSTVWVYAEIFQSDIGRVKVGDPASVTVDSYPDLTFPARVNYIWPEVDKVTRRARVRLEIPNSESKFLLGMFVNVELGLPLGDRLVIPASDCFSPARVRSHSWIAAAAI